jgi:hypothetical protein
MLDEIIQNSIGINDCIAFHSQNRLRLGMVVGESVGHVEVVVFQQVTSDISRQHSFKPLTASEYPMAHHGQMQELIGSLTDKLSVPRQAIADIVFIVPIKEVESGMFHVAGSRVAYFTRYFIDENRKVRDCTSMFYLEPYTVEPFTHRLFLSMNHLAHNLKRKMYHLKESDVTSKTFRIYFSNESFMYLSSKLPNAITATVSRKESSIVYYNSLQMEARTIVVSKTYLRILDKRALLDLRRLLGTGVGLGLSTGRPTKKCKFKYCTINGKLNSIELGDSIPAENVAYPLMATRSNGIDFIFSEESRQLTCNIRFTAITVSHSDVAKSRVPNADVQQPATSAYVGAWFLHRGVVLEVIGISNNIASCKEPDDDEDATVIELPLTLVSQLVDTFGR